MFKALDKKNVYRSPLKGAPVLIPAGLHELMSNIAKEVIRERPFDMYEFIAEYLETQVHNRTNTEEINDFVQFTIGTAKKAAEIYEYGIDKQTATEAAKKIQALFRSYKARTFRKTFPDQEGFDKFLQKTVFKDVESEQEKYLALEQQVKKEEGEKDWQPFYLRYDDENKPRNPPTTSVNQPTSDNQSFKNLFRYEGFNENDKSFCVMPDEPRGEFARRSDLSGISEFSPVYRTNKTPMIPGIINEANHRILPPARGVQTTEENFRTSDLVAHDSIEHIFQQEYFTEDNTSLFEMAEPREGDPRLASLTSQISSFTPARRTDETEKIQTIGNKKDSVPIDKISSLDGKNGVPNTINDVPENKKFDEGENGDISALKEEINSPKDETASDVLTIKSSATNLESYKESSSNIVNTNGMTPSATAVLPQGSQDKMTDSADHTQRNSDATGDISALKEEIISPKDETASDVLTIKSSATNLESHKGSSSNIVNTNGTTPSATAVLPQGSQDKMADSADHTQRNSDAIGKE